MVKTMIENGRKYIRSEDGNGCYKNWFVRMMQVISYLLKVLIFFGVIIFISEPIAEDTRSFFITMITKTIVSCVVMFGSYVLSSRIDESF